MSPSVLDCQSRGRGFKSRRPRHNQVPYSALPPALSPKLSPSALFLKCGWEFHAVLLPEANAFAMFRAGETVDVVIERAGNL